MKNSVQISLEIPEITAKNIIASLEKENTSNKRFSSKIFLKNNTLIISIEAEDIVALRATVNSYLRYLSAIEEIEENFK